MIKIMFICHGNICRSTMCESVFTYLVEKENLESFYKIDSSGTSYEEIGNDVYYKTKNVLSKNNIKVVPHKAKRITKEEAEEYDYLICMDNNNIRNLKRIIDEKDYNKVSLLCSYEIDDPWYTNNFDKTFNSVLQGCKDLLSITKKSID